MHVLSREAISRKHALRCAVLFPNRRLSQQRYTGWAASCTREISCHRRARSALLRVLALPALFEVCWLPGWTRFVSRLSLLDRTRCVRCVLPLKPSEKSGRFFPFFHTNFSSEEVEVVELKFDAKVPFSSNAKVQL